MEKAKNNKWLKATVAILAGTYEMEKKCAADFIQNMRIVFDDFFTTMEFPEFCLTADYFEKFFDEVLIAIGWNRPLCRQWLFALNFISNLSLH